MMHSVRVILGVVAVGAALSGCASWKADQAPFYIYNQGVLNEDVSVGYTPRRAGPSPRARPEPQRMEPARVAAADIDRSDAPRPSPPKAAPPAKKAAPAKQAEPTKKAEPAKKPAGKPAKGRFVPAHAANYMKAIYEANGVKLGRLEGDDAVATLFAEAKKQGQIYHATRPAVGDLVFFHNTWDRNGDNRNNDWYTHVGLVEGVDKDGTIYVLSWLDGQIQTFPINLEHPKLARDERSNKIWNLQLRNPGDDDPQHTQYLGGELFAGFAGLLGNRQEIVVIDTWAP